MWLVPIAVVATVVGLAVWYLGTQVQITHAVPEDFIIPGRSGVECGTSTEIYPPRNGDLQFSWATSDGHVGTMTLLASPNGPGEVLQLYYNSSSGGAADWVTWNDYHYTFEFCGAPGETAQVSGTLYYSAPLF